MDDGLDLVVVEGRAGAQPDEDGRGRVGLLGDEHGLFGEGELHGRGLDALHRADGLGELALHRTLVGGGLLELRGAHAHLVEERVAAVARGGQAGRGRLEAHLVDGVLRDHDRRTAVGELVGDPGGVELLDDGARVGRGEARVQRRVGGARAPRVEADDDGSQDTEPDERQRALRDRELLDGRAQAGGGVRDLLGHQACILMISVKASTALLRTAAVSSSVTAAWLAATV